MSYSSPHVTENAKENPDLTIIIPAFNEAKIILANVDELCSCLQEHQFVESFEIIVVDDGSTDGMKELLQSAVTTRTWLRTASHAVNIGRGKGVRTGFSLARGHYIVCLDADLSYSPDHVERLLAPLKSGKADITLASVYHPAGKVINVPTQRALLSRLGNKVLSMGFGGSLATVTCIVRGFTREVVESLELVGDGKELHLEIIQKARLLGFHIVEVPATLHWRDRKRGAGKRRKLFPEIAFFKMRKTVVSHLVFNYVSNPGILLFVPIALLLGAILTGSSMLLFSFVSRLGSTSDSLLQIVRQTLLDGQLTLIVVAFAFIFLMIFIGFYFLSFQSKRYFDETYTIVMRMNARIKQIESQLARTKDK